MQQKKFNEVAKEWLIIKKFQLNILHIQNMKQLLQTI